MAKFPVFPLVFLLLSGCGIGAAIEPVVWYDGQSRIGTYYGWGPYGSYFFHDNSPYRHRSEGGRYGVPYWYDSYHAGHRDYSSGIDIPGPRNMQRRITPPTGSANPQGQSRGEYHRGGGSGSGEFYRRWVAPRQHRARQRRW